MKKLSFKERCAISEQCLPDAPYRAMLEKLHAEMLEAIESQQYPEAWSVTFNGEHCGKFFFREKDAKEHKSRLDAKFPYEKHEVVPLFALKPKSEN